MIDHKSRSKTVLDELRGEELTQTSLPPVVQEVTQQEVVVDTLISTTMRQKAMNLEMESMYSNLVWDLVVPPEGIKPIRCKWIYKKRGVDKTMQTYEARL